MDKVNAKSMSKYSILDTNGLYNHLLIHGDFNINLLRRNEDRTSHHFMIACTLYL